MPLTLIKGEPSAVVWSMAEAQNVAASATFTSDPLPCDGYGAATVEVNFTQTHDRTLQVSDDGTTFYDLQAGGLHAVSPSATGVTTTPQTRAVAVALAGAKFLRVVIRNTVASAGTLTLRVILRTDAL